jgi:hypothetical protein
MSPVRLHRHEATHELDYRSDFRRRLPLRASWFLGWLVFIFILSAGVLLGRADTCSYTYQCSGPQCAAVMGGWSGTRSSSGITKDQCESARKMAPSSSPCTCTSDSSSTSTSTGGAIVSNTGNFKQDMVTNSVNLMIVSNTKNPIVSSFMQGAATSFISSMFANTAEAQRQQQAMGAEILRRQQEQEQQRRIAQQQRLDAMFARLNQALKLEGVPFGLSLKPMNTGADLQLKSMNSSGPEDLKLKMGDNGGHGIKGLPGIYVGGPAGSQTAANGNSADNESKGYGIQGLPGMYVGGPAGGQAGDTAAPANSGGMPGLPGIYLNGVQPSQAPALAQAAQTMNGPERTLAQDAALQAAQQNPALTAPSQDPRVEDFRQASQDYQQALQANASASRDYQTAQGHVEADKNAIEIAQNQLHATTPTVEQTQAFHQMLAAAQTDEDAAVAARKIFENADAHLSLTRTAAAGALANLTPASGATVASTTASTTVDLSGAKQMQPALLKHPESAGTPVLPARAPASAPVATAASRPSLPPADDLAACVATSARVTPGASSPASPEELRKQLESAKEALRRLIENHEKEDALREQWDEEVKDAIHDAKKQAFDLSVDYLLHKAQAVTRAKIWKADAEAEELQKLVVGEADPSKLASLRSQIGQASARAQNLQHTLQSLKDLKDGVEEQERLRDLREWAQTDPQELQQAAGYLEGVKQLVQAALAENSVKAALQYTPYVNDAIKWGSSLIDTSYDLTAEYLGSRQLDQLNRNSDQYLQAVKVLNKRIQVTVARLNCYKMDGRPAGPTNLQVIVGRTR